MPSHADLAAFYRRYNESYSGGGGSGGRNLRRYAQRYLSIVKKVVQRGTLIDVGSSTNPFPNLAARAGFDVTVLDYRRPELLDPGVRFVQGSINVDEPCAAMASTFDVVTAWAVIEHLPSPRDGARLLAGLCRPGGTLFLSTPEIGTALTDHSLGRSAWLYPPEHLCLQSPRAVAEVYAAHGLELQTWGRLELSPARHALRYGIGAIEAGVGWPFKRLLPRRWQAWRDRGLHRFQVITYFVFARR